MLHICIYSTSSFIISGSIMGGVFYHEEPPNPSSRCKCLSSSLKEAFSHCRTFTRQLSASYLEEEEYPSSDLEEYQEEVVSEIRMRAMEKLRKRPAFTMETFSCIFPPHMEAGEDLEKMEEFRSVRSCFTCSSSVVTMDAFHSAKSNFSSSLSLGELEFQFMERRSIMQEFCHCEGWPFGLCKKLLLLPPLPKSPTESWSWRRDKRVEKIPYI